MRLDELVRRAAERAPEAEAVRTDARALSYGDLDLAANRAAHVLAEMGVAAGDRVGIWLEKSAEAVVAMQATLRLGAAYVPVDPLSPPLRAGALLRDCAVRAIVTSAGRRQSLPPDPHVRFLLVDHAPQEGMRGWRDVESAPATAVPAKGHPSDLAYILYTSGSTGRPKGVCLSHGNGLAFVDWAVAETGLTGADRLSNHAPFHFDLSVFDLYAAFAAGASVHVIPEAAAYVPSRLVETLVRQRLTVWYSVPSALILMMQKGGLLEADAPFLRAVLFAGEVFPIKHLRELRRRFSRARFLNLYGPTETNVCTAYEVGEIPPDQSHPVPIGRPCCGDSVVCLRPDGSEAATGEEGELCVTGPTVMLGYWGQPAQGDRPYATGDIVRREPDGDLVYVGRRDHLVKVRGYRVELGEIEAALLAHGAFEEAAVCVSGAGAEARLVAFVVTRDERAASLLAVKEYLAMRLPKYMIVDRVHVLPALPRTRNGKVDRADLAARADARGAA